MARLGLRTPVSVCLRGKSNNVPVNSERFSLPKKAMATKRGESARKNFEYSLPQTNVYSKK